MDKGRNAALNTQPAQPRPTALTLPTPPAPAGPPHPAGPQGGLLKLRGCARARAALMGLLTGVLGFQLAERKETVSLHLEEMGRSTHHVLSLIRGADG